MLCSRLKVVFQSVEMVNVIVQSSLRCHCSWKGEESGCFPSLIVVSFSVDQFCKSVCEGDRLFAS